MSQRGVHHGRNIKRIREILGVKQEALALELGDEWSQRKVSLLEGKERLDDALLEQVALALHVPVDAIENFNEEAAINIVSSTLHDNAGSINNSCTLTFNPLDKWLEALEENKKLYQEKIELYERMLKDKTDMIEKLEKLLLTK
ncbi:MAG TPA: helix-turn-helix transcriptional regulator [Flavisolibacter sp.]|nr:helix-turn-helix transcriptional regulator [Flavisolibacter sp.]